MSGGHFDYHDPNAVGEAYCGQWQDMELDALFFDLFGGGWDGWRGVTGKERVNEFGRTWADPRYTGGLAETLDLYLSGDIDEKVYREQVKAFKAKWLSRKTPKSRVEFYQREFERTATEVMERCKRELGEI
jgi:hypothetical protein